MNSRLFLLCAVLSGCAEPAEPGAAKPAGADWGTAPGTGPVTAPGSLGEGAVSLGPPEFEPLGSAVSCNPQERVSPHVYVRRIKSLLTGLAPTAEDLAAVQQDPGALRALVEKWIETDEYRSKRRTFFVEAFQQDNWLDLDLNELIGNFEVGAALRASLTEMVARTAEYLVDAGRPFNEIASTDTWVMNTQLMSFLVSADVFSSNGYAGDVRIYHDPVVVAGQTLDQNTPLSVQIANRHLYSPVAFGGKCSDPYLERRSI